MKPTRSLKHTLRTGLHWLTIFSWVAGLVLTVSPVRVALAFTFVVDRTDDVLASTCSVAANDCSLRGAIIFANSFPGADVLAFDPTVISGATTFNLTRPDPDPDADSGDLDITDDLTISPLITQTIIINGSTMTSTERVFEIIGARVTISGTTIQGGHPDAPGGGIDLDASSTVTLTNSTVTSNTSTAGGGIRNDGGILILDNTIVSSNSTSGSGGGISNEGSGTVTLLNNSVIMSNTSGSDGGGLSTTGAVILTNSTIGPSNVTTQTTASGGGLSISGSVLVSLTTSNIVSNTAANNGGGINNSGGTLTMSGGAIQGNTSNSTTSTNGGGGLRNSGGGTATLTDVTLSGNQNTGTDSRGAGILNSSGQITLSGSTVTGNTASGTGADGGGLALAAGTTVTLTSSTTVSNNTADDTAGGIHNNGGTLILSTSSVLTNTADIGGGLLNDNAGSLTMTGGALSGNTATSTTGGGGLRNNNGGIVTITSATLENNTAPAGEGGGLLNTNGTLNLTGVTLGPGNSASDNGGGVSNATATTSLTINNSTITGNSAANGGGGINNSDGSVSLTNSTVTSNTATGANGGGGLRNSAGTANITTSTFSNNSTTTNDGGGLRNVSGGTIHIITSTINNNTAGLGVGNGDGGGIANEASSVFITSTVIYSNTADGGNGNGIYSDNAGADLRLDNVTLSANTGTGGGGGGLHNDGGSTAILANVTIKDNDQSGNNGDGVRNAGTLTIRNSALVNNGTENCDNTGGTLTSQGYNLKSDISASCNSSLNQTGDITDTVPLFGPLANNGGSTLTHALLTGSPAIDAGNNVAGCLNTAGAVFATDQRGSPRPVNGRCDIGAYEFVSADLAISKTDDQTIAVPGTQIVYTILVTNTSSVVTVTDALVTDTFPAAQLTNVSWSCTANVGATCDTLGGFGDITATVDLGPNASATFMVNADVLGNLTGGTLTNTAYITPSAGIADPDSTDNSSTDVDTIEPHVDLTLTKDDGQTTDIPGTTIVYTLTIGNNGPSDVSNAPVTDTAPAALTGVTWSCSALVGSNCDSPSGSNNINTTVDVAKDGTVTFVLTGSIPSDATGTLLNTAGITVPVGTIEDAPADNADDDTTTLAPTVDLGISKTDGQFTTTAGSLINYTIVVSNTGPSDAASATVTDTFPTEIESVTWTCVGAACPAPSGSGDINDTLTLLSGGSATYSVSGTVALTATSNIINTAYVAPAAGTTDSDTSNNEATDSTSLNNQTIDLSLTKDDGQTTAVPGTAITYTIVVANSGNGAATDATVTDSLPAGVDGPNATWDCVAGPSSNCDSISGTGDINVTVDIAIGGAVTFTVNAAIDADATGTLSNTASVVASVFDVEPDISNNQATDSTILTPQADLAIAKTGNPPSVVPGSTLTYTITVNNIGPSAVTSATVTDTFPTEIENVTWSCVATGGAACPATSGNGDINGTVNLPAGVGTVTFIATGTLTTTAVAGTLTNTAYVAAPVGVTEINVSNNSATDTTTIVTSFQYLYLPLIRR